MEERGRERVREYRGWERKRVGNGRGGMEVCKRDRVGDGRE